MKNAHDGRREFSFAAKNFVCAGFAADQFSQIVVRQAHLLHSEFDCFNRVGRLDGIVFAFVCFDQQ